MTKSITHLIVNSPYVEPKHHWHYHRETQTFSLKAGRRPAGYVIASESSKAFDDPGRFIPIELVRRVGEGRQRTRRFWEVESWLLLESIRLADHDS